MTKKSNRRPQTPKVGNFAMAQAFQEIRRSSAASPHRNKAKYTRKTKHKGREF